MKLKHIFFFALCVLCSAYAGSQQTTDSLLKELNKAITNTGVYDSKKRGAITAIKASFNNSLSLTDQYLFNAKLYEEYKVFTFDSAFAYAGRLETLAYRMNDSSRLVAANNKMAFVLVSAGLFKEALEKLNAIKIHHQPDSVKAEFYSLMSRCYYDLADYNSDALYTPEYLKKGNAYIDSALIYYPVNSFNWIYLAGLKNLKTGNLDKAQYHFETLMNDAAITNRQTALVASTLSYIYKQNGNNAIATNHQIRAAIADIQSSTKETFAILNLAQLLFSKGDFNYRTTVRKNWKFYINLNSF